MDVGNLWFTQRSLRRSYQIAELVEDIRAFEYTPREFIFLGQSPDGSVQIINGHHRVAAFWLAGIRFLDKAYYRLAQYDYHPFPMIWQVKEIEKWLPLMQSEIVG